MSETKIKELQSEIDLANQEIMHLDKMIEIRTELGGRLSEINDYLEKGLDIDEKCLESINFSIELYSELIPFCEEYSYDQLRIDSVKALRTLKALKNLQVTK